jgi:hypothetical protein
MTRAKDREQRTGGAQNQKIANIEAVQSKERVVRFEHIQPHRMVKKELPQGMKPVGRVNSVKRVEFGMQRIPRNRQIVEGVGLVDRRLGKR